MANEELEVLDRTQNIIFRLKERMERDIDLAELELFRLKMEIKGRQDKELDQQALKEVR